MKFDPARTRLEGSVDDLRDLVRRVAAGGDVHPQIATMVDLVVDPLRNVVVDRLDRSEQRPVHVGFDGEGQVALTERRIDGQITVTSSHLTVLPILLLQSLRLHRNVPSPAQRLPIVVRPSAFGHAVDELSGPDGPTGVWRAWGAWRGRDVDAELRVVSTSTNGVWLVDPDGRPDRLTLLPCTAGETTARLGDVITGRRPRASVA